MEEKILRNNKIIDKYMGYGLDKDIPTTIIISHRKENPPKYNESWDLIIPVAQKVLFDLDNFGNRAKIKNNGKTSFNRGNKYEKFIESIYHRYSRIKYSLEEFKLEDFYNQIVESIVFMSLYENFDDDSKKDEPLHFF